MVSSLERGTARQYGIDVDASLHSWVADFYVLEQMVSDAYTWNGDVRFLKGVYPSLYGMDNRIERIQYHVKQSFEALVDKLCHQLGMYTLLAAVGEARWYTALDQRVLAQVTAEGDDEFDPPNGSIQMPEGMVPGEHFTEVTLYDVLDHRIVHYMMTINEGQDYHSATNRYVAWEQAGELLDEFDNDMTALMRELAKVFTLPIWGHTVRIPDSWQDNEDAWAPFMNGMALINYQGTGPWQEHANSGHAMGGAAWALPCHMTADMLEGNIQRSTYVDRMWSVQHNSGSFFNKVWDTTRLNACLGLQQSEDGLGRGYQLLVRHCSDGNLVNTWMEYWSARKGEIVLPGRTMQWSINQESDYYDNYDTDEDDSNGMCDDHCEHYYDSMADWES